MKNKNIKNKPQKCGRWLFLHSRFSKNLPGEDTRTPPPSSPYKENTSIKPSKSFFNNNSSQRQKKKKKKKVMESPPPSKQSTRNLCIRYTEIEKRRRALGQDLFCVIGLFETLIFAIAEDKVCDSCIVSSWALLIFLLCLWWPNINFLCCVITQNGESSCDLLLSVTNRKKLWLLGATAPQSPL